MKSGPSWQTDESDALEGVGILPFHPGLSSVGQTHKVLLATEGILARNRRRCMMSS